MIANGFLRSDLFVLIGVTSDGSSFAVEPSSENRVTVVGVGEMSQKADMAEITCPHRANCRHLDASDGAVTLPRRRSRERRAGCAGRRSKVEM
jgi:hypothetical protein